MKLFYTHIPIQYHTNKEELPSLYPMVFIHGFLGSGINLRALANKFATLDYPCYLPDLRNHGSSFHSEEMSYEVMAKDIYDLVSSLGIKKLILCGHSMGGKVAIRFCQKYPQMVEKSIILDMSPSYRDVSYFENLLQYICKININSYHSRHEIKQKMINDGFNSVLVDFLLKNLMTSPRMYWRANFTLFQKNLTFLSKEISFSKPIETNTLFVYGEKSDYVQEKDKKTIIENFKNVEIMGMIDAGHWIHYENSAGLYDLIIKFIKNENNPN